MTRRARLRWLGEQVGWLLGCVACVVLLVFLLPVLPVLRAFDRARRWLDEE